MSKIVEPGHNFMICPYNDAHQILQYRFQKHIVKCARQHPHIKLLVCPFNSCHRIAPEKMKVRKCKENVRLEHGWCRKEKKKSRWRKCVFSFYKYNFLSSLEGSFVGVYIVLYTVFGKNIQRIQNDSMEIYITISTARKIEYLNRKLLK